VKIIRKDLEGALFSFLGPSTPDWTNNYDGTGNPAPYYADWTYVGQTAGPRWYQQDTIDISGVTSLQEKALLPAFIECQQSPIYRAGGTAATEPDNYAFELVMITTIPFDVDAYINGQIGDFLPMRTPTIFGRTANPTIETLSAGQCLFGRTRYLQNDIETFERNAVVKGESFWGHLEPTMADELYVTRIVGWMGSLQVGAIFTLPDIQFCIHTDTTELSELSQIMELRRSYLTQQNI
jgi:hypothetical protein